MVLVAVRLIAWRSRGRLVAAALARALPFGGSGPRFFALCCGSQFAVFLMTQSAEGSPMSHGSLGLGLLTAAAVSIVGTVILSCHQATLIEAITELVWFIGTVMPPATRASVARARRRPTVRPTRSRSYTLFIPNRPPPAVPATTP
jgi:hypothetical protein